MSSPLPPPPPPPRRIIVSNLPLPSPLTTTSTNRIEPAVQVTENELDRKELLGGWAGQLRVGGEEEVPVRSWVDTYTTIKPIPNEGIVLPRGVNIQFNELAPGGFVPMHRTTSTDYAIFNTGQVTLITPGKAFDAEVGTWKDDVVETVCNPGDVLIQRGTLHAWENRTNEWARFLTFIIGAEPNSVGVEGDGEGARRDLPAVFDGTVL